MSTMFNALLCLPLFQGLSQEDFTNILGKVKLHFIKYQPETIIIKNETSCKELIFLLKGEIECATTPEDQSFTYIETIKEPCLIEPEALFGMNPYYKSSYTAKTEANIMSINKMLIIKELLKYEVFRLNYVNNISNRVQSIHNRLWKTPLSGTENKILHFFLTHAEKQVGEKTIFIKMDDLARILDDTRLNVSKVLNSLQERKLLQLKRRMIFIPEIAELIPFY